LCILIPVAYEKTEGAAYRRTLQEVLKTIRDTLQSHGVMQTLRELSSRDPFEWDKMAWFGDYIAVSYEGPRGYRQLIDKLYEELFKKIPGAQKTYPVEAAPHISIGHLRKGELKPAASLIQPILSGTPQRNLVLPDSELVLDLRVISGTDPNGYRTYTTRLQ
jgi:hypothetical protein